MSKDTVYLGLDVDKEKIAAAALMPGPGSQVVERIVANRPATVKKYVERLTKEYEVIATYEAGCFGFELYRQLTDLGVACLVAAPGLIPRKPSDRVKTDRRDARTLALALRADQVVGINIPSRRDEAVRDFLRMYEDTRSELKRAKQQILHFLLRHGYQYTEGTNWTQKHRVWISSLKFKTQMEEETLSFYVSRMQSVERMCEEILGRIEEIAEQPEYEKRVRKLKAFKGIRSLIALSFIVDIGDFRRFVSAAQFMAFLGLVPSEHSSGNTRRQGGITKAGNSHLRRLLVEAAWCYRSYHPTSATLLKRREGLPAELIRYADRAGRRLNRKYLRLLHRGKPSQVAMIAVTRELAGFVWGAMVEQAA